MRRLTDRDGGNLLIRAIESGNLKVVECLVNDFNFDPNAVLYHPSAGNNYTNNRRSSCVAPTPLIAAVRAGHLDIVQFLIAKGAKSHYERGDLQTTTVYQLRHYRNATGLNFGKQECSPALTISENDSPSHYPLHEAIKIKDKAVAKEIIHELLTMRDIDIHKLAGEDMRSFTALNLAIASNCPKICRLLVDNNADLSLKNVRNMTVIDMVNKNQVTDEIKQILSSAIDRETKRHELLILSTLQGMADQVKHGQLNLQQLATMLNSLEKLSSSISQ